MKKINLIILFLISLFVTFLAGTFVSKPQETVTIVKTDTIVVRDTLRFDKPKPDKVYVKGDSIFVDKIINKTDTFFVFVPRTVKEYNTDNYKAIISGFEPNLDFIETYNTTKYVTETITNKNKPKWGVGVQIGMSYVTDTKRFSPTVGVGVQYNLISW